MVDGSLLDVVGLEIIGIICPVSICMLLVVSLVKELQQEVTNTVLTSVASLVYSEDSTDSDWTKFMGALVNAGVFVAVVTVVTFILVLLFYFRCTKFLRAYMAVAAFTVLAYMGGTIAIMLIQKLAIPVDVITASIILYNFSIVGVLAIFLCRVPIVVTQGYLVLVGVLVAFWFTSLPEWTTWVLLIAISLYDIVAVLTPGGPLNLLVQLAMTRDEELPALIYEARPIISDASVSRALTRPHVTTSTANNSTSNSTIENVRWRHWKRRRNTTSAQQSLFHRTLASLGIPLLHRREEEEEISESLHSLGTDAVFSNDHEDQTVTTFLGREEMQNSTQHQSDRNMDILPMENYEAHQPDDDIEGIPLVQTASRSVVDGPRARLPFSNTSDLQGHVANQFDNEEEEDEDGIGLGASGAIKLGLGDFIFYSVLVGRAALYDMTTVYACYLAIVTGLGATLALLAVWRRALPALPISIALGIIFYFLTRLLMEPFIMQNSVNLLFF